MSEKRYIVTESQILDNVEFALKLNIQEQSIVDILMHDIEEEIETLLEFYCEEYKESEEEWHYKKRLKQLTH